MRVKFILFDFYSFIDDNQTEIIKQVIKQKYFNSYLIYYKRTILMIKKAKRNDVNTALLICDMLNDFVKKEAPLEVPAARDIVPGIKKQIQLARKSCIPVIYCCDAHKSNDPEFSLWPRHAVKGTEGACIVKQLEPEKDDYIVHKTNYSCFYKTSLQTLLKQLGTTHLILTGVVTNICILYTVAEAYMRGYTTTIPGDCVAALTQKDHKYALQQMKRVFNAKIL